MVILRWLINAAALILTSAIVPGFEVNTFFSALIAALVLGLVNIAIRPLLLILTLPINILTFGLFTFIINALMIELVAMIVKNFTVVDFKAAFLGALVLTIISWLVDFFLKSSLVVE